MPPVPGQVTDPSLLMEQDVEVPTDEGPIRAHVVRPAAETPVPAVLVVHEAFGVVEHTRDVAGRFANAGFLAMAPDLYTRVGAPDPSEITSVMRQMLSVPDKRAMADLQACADWLRRQDESNGRVGIIGFCSGGRQTLLAACDVDVDAAVDCWGGFVARASPDADTTPERPVPPMQRLDDVSCPLLLVGGQEDTNPSPEQVRTIAAALEDRVWVNHWIAADAGHAFFADYRPSYHEPAAFELWGRVLAFFEGHLR